MATIGTITTVFDSDLKGLQKGATDASALLKGLIKNVEDITDQLELASESTVAIKAAVDGSEVEDLKEEIEKKSPTVKVKADTKKAKEDVDRLTQAMEVSWKSFAKNVKENQPLNGLVDTAKSVRSAVDGVGDAIENSIKNLGNMEKTVDSLIVATGRYRGAASAVAAIYASSNTSVRGLSNIYRAFRGDTVSAAVALGGLGGTLTSVAVAAGMEAVAVGAARYATAGMSKEAQGYAEVAAQAASAWVSTRTAGVVAAVSFNAITRAAYESTGAADFFVKAIQRLGSEVRNLPPTVTMAAAAMGDLFAGLELVRAATGHHASMLGWIGLATRMAASAAAFGVVTGAVSAMAAGTSVLEGAATGAGGALSRFAGILPSIAIFSGAAAVATGRFRHEMQHMAGEVREIRNMADRFGATTQQIEEMRYAAAYAGVGMTQLAKGQQQLYTSLSKIKVGQINTENVREAKLAFDRLRISVETLREAKPHEIFELIAEKISKIEDPADRVAIAFDLFGKQGAAILPALKSIEKVRGDIERLDVTTNNLEFARAEELANSFSRMSRGIASFGEAGLTGFIELQTAFNNFAADFFGGLATLSQNMGSIFADASEPLAQVIEILGRVLNIVFRLAGAFARLVGAASDFPAAARLVTLIGESIKQALVPIEKLVDGFSTFAQITYDQFVPQYFKQTGENVQTLSEALAEAATNFVISTGVAVALFSAMQSLNPSMEILKKQLIDNAKYAYDFVKKLKLADVTSIISKVVVGAIKFMSVSLVQLATDATIASISFIRSMIVMDKAAIKASLSTVASMLKIAAVTVFAFAASPVVAMKMFVVTIWNAAMQVSAASLAMAASWVIATAGLALLLIAAAEIYQNFDKITAWFGNWQENLANLFTFDGLKEAFSGVGEYFKGVFVGVFNSTKTFMANFVMSVKRGFAGIKEPEKRDATKASAASIGKRRAEIAEGNAQAQTNANATAAKYNLIDQSKVKVEAPVEDQKKLQEAVNSSRESIDLLMIESAKYGDAASAPAEAALAAFSKLQDKFDNDPTMGIEAFQEESEKIAEDLKNNFKFFSEDNATAALKKNREFFKQLNDSAKEFAKSAREIEAGTVIEGKLFPTSGAIKSELSRVQAEYQKAIEEIQYKKQKGMFGSGQAGELNAAIAVEDAQRAQKRSMDEIGRDTSFADEIRKSLDTAFLSGPQKLEKELKKIASNKSLNNVEKALAAASAKKEYAEGVFGKSAGKEFQEKLQGVQYLDQDRQRGAMLNMSAEGRASLGLDENPGEKMAIGVEKINDMFGLAGKSVNEARAALRGMPADLALYDEAVAKNRETVMQSLGVEKSGVSRLQELNDKLRQAGATQTEMDTAMRKAFDGFASSLGIAATPAEEFAKAESNIAEQFGLSGLSLDQMRQRLKGNSDALGLFDRAVKSAKESLLQSVGIDKTPQAEFLETMKKITDAGNRLTQSEVQLAEVNAKRKRDEALGAGETSGNFRSKLLEQQQKLQEAYGANGEKAPEEFAAGIRNLLKSIPGGQESPLVKFREDLAKLDASGLGGREYAERKMSLQADLQESLMPALQSVMPDRRSLEGADTRSKAGVDTFFRILRGNDNPSLKAQLQVVRNTRELVEATRDKNAAPIVAQLGRR
jgi:hypothetical protein